MKIKAEELKNLVYKILNLKPKDIGCDACIAELNAFVELKLAGKSAEESLPLVATHLEQCRDCKEEFEVLLQILKEFPQN